MQQQARQYVFFVQNSLLYESLNVFWHSLQTGNQCMRARHPRSVVFKNCIESDARKREDSYQKNSIDCIQFMTLSGEKMIAANVANGGLKDRLKSLRPAPKPTKPKTLPENADADTTNTVKSVVSDAPQVISLEEASKLKLPPLPPEDDDVVDPADIDASIHIVAEANAPSESAESEGAIQPKKNGEDVDKASEKQKTKRWLFSRASSKDSTDASVTETDSKVKPIKRSASFSRRKPSTSSSSSSVAEATMTAGSIIHNKEREEEQKRRYEERMARARSKRRVEPPSTLSTTPPVDPLSFDWPDDEGDPSEAERPELSGVEEEGEDGEGHIDEGPESEGMYVRRDGRWYDMEGNEFRPKRIIRFVWR